MLTRLGNKVYELARSGVLSLPGFPQFEPILNALKTGFAGDRNKSFRVSTQQHDKLIVLEALARKWVEHEQTKERAIQAIEDHNAEYNPAGLYWMEERTGWDKLNSFPLLKVFLNIMLSVLSRPKPLYSIYPFIQKHLWENPFSSYPHPFSGERCLMRQQKPSSRLQSESSWSPSVNKTFQSLATRSLSEIQDKNQFRFSVCFIKHCLNDGCLSWLSWHKEKARTQQCLWLGLSWRRGRQPLCFVPVQKSIVWRAWAVIWLQSNA